MPNIDTTNPDCVCQVKYYYDAPKQLCEPCSPLCSSCDEPTSLECLGNCVAMSNVNQTFLGAHNECECSNHYFYNSTDCQICHPLCANCVNSTNFDCITSCATSSPYIVAMATTPIQCICAQHSYYSSFNQTCMICHPLCGNCTTYGSNYCTDFCTTGIALVNNSLLTSSGVCNCNYHYYFNEDTVLCEICDHFCGDCIGKLSIQCTTTCNTNYTQMNMTLGSPKECKCNNHYFFDTGISDCALCHPLCGDCYGYLNTECIRKYINRMPPKRNFFRRN